MSLRMMMEELSTRQEAAENPDDYASQCYTKAKASMKKVSDLVLQVESDQKDDNPSEQVHTALHLVELLPSLTSHVDIATSEIRSRETKGEAHSRVLIAECAETLTEMQARQESMVAPSANMINAIAEFAEVVAGATVLAEEELGPGDGVLVRGQQPRLQLTCASC